MTHIMRVALALGTYLSTAAYAQVVPDAAAVEPAASGTDTAVPGEIVVTAQRRTERLQDTPIAVTAVTAQVVQSLGLTNVIDIAAVTPGASFNSSSGGFFAPRIRGIGVDTVSVGLEMPVAIYEDGAYLTRNLALNEILENFDIGSVQVLRGPQGTLYGRNATGGVIIVNSADPTPRFEGRVRAEYGNYDHQQLNAMINVPLGEDLAFRATGSYKKDDGFVHNLNTGQDAGGGRAYSVRAKLRWQPGNADITLGGQYYNTKYALGPLSTLGRKDSTCYACVLSPGIVRPSTGFFETENRTFVQPLRTEYIGVNLNMVFDFDTFKLSSTTTYRRQKSRDSGGDSDATPLPLFEFAVPDSGGTSYTQDVQVTSTLDGPFNYLFGLSYLHDKGYLNPNFLGLAFGGSVDPATAPGFDNTATTSSYAAFLEGYYQLTDRLKVTVGGRYTYEERGAHGFTDAAFAAVLGLPSSFSFDLQTSQRAFTPRFVLAWDNGPTNLYYSFTRGFKAGGFPGPYIFPVAPVLPEKIFSHEVGIKQSLLDNRVRFNAAAFYFKNKNQQSQTIDLNSGGIITANAGALENYGIEIEAQATPMEGLNLGLSGAWQHARYQPFRAASLVCFDPTGQSNLAAPGATLYPCTIDITGTTPPQAPDWTGSFNASYTFAVGSWSASVSGLAQYRSSINFLPAAGGELGYDRDGERFLVNASGYVSPPGDNLRLGFYVNNIFDKHYATLRSTAQPYGTYYVAARPRTYGLRLEYSF
ncbi:MULTISPECIES: TonB-dependent receptor [Sphingobium]|uniref:TonB-dependent receptor n=1 Tax=Sphingobium TaxID=165695 RepID=UPI00159BF461|nr:TonB-dependent receptor [Sphingobium sp. 15-1]